MLIAIQLDHLYNLRYSVLLFIVSLLTTLPAIYQFIKGPTSDDKRLAPFSFSHLKIRFLAVMSYFQNIFSQQCQELLQKFTSNETKMHLPLN